MKNIYINLSRLFIVVGFLAFATVAFAQNQSVSGTVTDENGEPAPGVSIVEKGTTNGTASDTQGKFVLNVADANSILVFSFIGYKTQEMAVGGRTVVDLKLEADVTALQEIVVTGYSEQRKRDITGAVTVVDAEALKSIKAASVGQQLAGRAPGVTVSTSGGPGDGANIRIRGVNSITGSSDPLVIIDGVQIQGDKALTGLNPNDIESMQILKDAASSSIYGSRANNGVIIITTKQGKSGKMKVTYNGYVGTQNPVGGYNDFLVKDPLKYAQQYHTIKNPGTSDFYGGVGTAATIPTTFYHPTGNTDESTYNYPVDPRTEPTLFMRSNPNGTDWWDEVFDPASIVNHNIGLSGGGETGTFAASVDYFKQNGTMKYTNFERFTARINSTLKSGRFTFGETFSFARSAGVTQQGGNQNEQNVMTNILKMNSIVPVYDISGTHFASAKALNFSNGQNPLALSYRNKDDQNINYRILGGVNGEFKITDYLRVKSNFAIDFGQNYNPNFSFPTWENREVNSGNFFQETHRTDFNWVWTNTLHFNKVLAEKHNISAFVGYEAVKAYGRQISGRLDGYGFTNTDVRYLQQSLAPTVNTLQSSAISYNTLASVFGKIDYAFNDKYLLSVTVRRDGSSNFAPSKRFGTFPAFSVGWRLSEESFMQNYTWLDDLKLRGGYGVTGNQIIAAYNAYDRWGARSTFDASYDIGGTNTGNNAGFALTSFGNPNTGWEENRMSNFGLDATLFNGKIGFVFDVYNKDITNLLYNGPLPGPAGAANPDYRNTANMTNKGWDASINYRGDLTSDLSFDLGLNLSHYKNKITALEGDTKLLFPAGIDKRFGEVNVWQVGNPISSFYGYRLAGIFQNDAEVAAIDQTGSKVGRFKWEDINGDGHINDADKVVIGNPHPKLTAGLNIGLNYKAIDFNLFLYGSWGNKIYNYNKLFTHFGFFNSNVHEDVLTDSWVEGEGGSLPAIDPDDNFSLTSSSFYVENGSYVRAQNVSLGYTIPGNKVFQKVRIYVQAQNLFTITKYSGIDPAISSVNVGQTINGQQQNDAWAGFDFGNYPSSKTFMLGLNASF
jgi:TonB-linked SusC/RagA family outer membrane protein